ncbi:MAG TPA: DUF2190 family protein [Bacillota bacterium]|nr:DUF2190 family protein [Bacillota bacterium]HPZ14588.1 DUF2190 family protein [Bacillota bacterium]
MAAKFVSEGKVLRYTTTPAVARGDVVVIGSLVGVALEDIPAGGTGAVAISGIFEVPKEAVAVTQGAKLYRLTADGKFTTSTSNSVFAGYAAEAAASGDATVKVLLHPPGA